MDPEKERFFVEIMPTFKGGEPSVEFYAYILKHLRYPEQAAQNNISGRVINSSPLLEPGIQSGQRVSVSYVFPISFVLQ